MRMFVFSMRTFDELPCFEKYCPKYGIEYELYDGDALQW